MSALIKGEAAQWVRAFAAKGAQAKAPPAAAASRRRCEDPQFAGLREENERLRAELKAARRDEATAREEGRREALEEARAEEARRADALEAGLAAALTVLERRLAELEALAPLVARTALGRLFDECDDLGDFVVRTIGRQMTRLRRETVLGVRVSAGDFPDEAALAALRARAGTGSVEIVVDDDLDAGQCRVDLTLGHIDLDIPGQWDQLAALLDEAAREDVG